MKMKKTMVSILSIATILVMMFTTAAAEFSTTKAESDGRNQIERMITVDASGVDEIETDIENNTVNMQDGTFTITVKKGYMPVLSDIFTPDVRVAFSMQTTPTAETEAVWIGTIENPAVFTDDTMLHLAAKKMEVILQSAPDSAENLTNLPAIDLSTGYSYDIFTDSTVRPVDSYQENPVITFTLEPDKQTNELKSNNQICWTAVINYRISAPETIITLLTEPYTPEPANPVEPIKPVAITVISDGSSHIQMDKVTINYLDYIPPIGFMLESGFTAEAFIEPANEAIQVAFREENNSDEKNFSKWTAVITVLDQESIDINTTITFFAKEKTPVSQEPIITIKTNDERIKLISSSGLSDSLDIAINNGILNFCMEVQKGFAPRVSGNEEIIFKMESSRNVSHGWARWTASGAGIPAALQTLEICAEEGSNIISGIPDPNADSAAYIFAALTDGDISKGLTEGQIIFDSKSIGSPEMRESISVTLDQSVIEALRKHPPEDREALDITFLTQLVDITLPYSVISSHHFDGVDAVLHIGIKTFSKDLPVKVYEIYFSSAGEKIDLGAVPAFLIFPVSDTYREPVVVDTSTDCKDYVEGKISAGSVSFSLPHLSDWTNVMEKETAAALFSLQGDTASGNETANELDIRFTNTEVLTTAELIHGKANAKYLIQIVQSGVSPFMTAIADEKGKLTFQVPHSTVIRPVTVEIWEIVGFDPESGMPVQSGNLNRQNHLEAQVVPIYTAGIMSE